MGVDVAEAVASDGFLHRALLYRGAAEFRAAIERYVRGGLSHGEPVLVATSPGKVGWLRREFKDEPPRVAFTDMTELGRNPARIIPAIRTFMDRYPGRRIWWLGEPVWPERSDAELREAARYEALVNTAFSGTQATMVCLYDQAGLVSSVLDVAGLTNPALFCHGEEQASSSYLGPDGLPPGCDHPLARPPAAAECLTYRRDLRPVRHPGGPVRAQRAAARRAHHRPGPGGQRGGGQHVAAHQISRDRVPVA